MIAVGIDLRLAIVGVAIHFAVAIVFFAPSFRTIVALDCVHALPLPPGPRDLLLAFVPQHLDPIVQPVQVLPIAALQLFTLDAHRLDPLPSFDTPAALLDVLRRLGWALDAIFGWPLACCHGREGDVALVPGLQSLPSVVFWESLYIMRRGQPAVRGRGTQVGGFRSFLWLDGNVYFSFALAVGAGATYVRGIVGALAALATLGVWPEAVAVYHDDK
jgi:hypothetical protein